MLAPDLLKSSPLFSDLPTETLAAFLEVFEQQRVPAGTVLFEAGAISDTFAILAEGRISVSEEGEERLVLDAVAPVGELAALAGVERHYTATTLTDARLLVASVAKLRAFFEQHGAFSVAIHRNLLAMATRKIARDRRRTAEMRANIMATQRSMKRMREALLEGEDTPLHAGLFEELDAQIEQNRKGHYLVEPSRQLPTRVRFDDGSVSRVAALSNEWVYVARAEAPALEVGKDVTCVLVAGERELPLSGTVDHVTEHEIAIYLDELIDDWARVLELHLGRLQLLDVVL